MPCCLPSLWASLVSGNDDAVALKRVGSCIDEVEDKRKLMHPSLQIDRLWRDDKARRDFRWFDWHLRAWRVVIRPREANIVLILTLAWLVSVETGGGENEWWGNDEGVVINLILDLFFLIFHTLKNYLTFCILIPTCASIYFRKRL